MTETASKTEIFLARLAVALVIAFIVLGAIWYGVSAEVRGRVWQDLMDRPFGPMMFRFILQPIMAAIAALHDGVKDARAGSSPYFWAILTNRGERSARLREGFISTARVIILGLVMDVTYQLIVLHTFYPGEAAIVALLLAFVPYLLLRGLFFRLASWRSRETSTRQPR